MSHDEEIRAAERRVLADPEAVEERRRFLFARGLDPFPRELWTPEWTRVFSEAPRAPSRGVFMPVFMHACEHRDRMLSVPGAVHHSCKHQTAMSKPTGIPVAWSLETVKRIEFLRTERHTLWNHGSVDSRATWLNVPQLRLILVAETHEGCTLRVQSNFMRLRHDGGWDFQGSDATHYPCSARVVNPETGGIRPGASLPTAVAWPSPQCISCGGVRAARGPSCANEVFHSPSEQRRERSQQHPSDCHIHNHDSRCGCGIPNGCDCGAIPRSRPAGELPISGTPIVIDGSESFTILPPRLPPLYVTSVLDGVLTRPLPEAICACSHRHDAHVLSRRGPPAEPWATCAGAGYGDVPGQPACPCVEFRHEGEPERVEGEPLRPRPVREAPRNEQQLLERERLNDILNDPIQRDARVRETLGLEASAILVDCASCGTRTDLVHCRACGWENAPPSP